MKKSKSSAAAPSDSSTGPRLTTHHGVPVGDDQNSHKAGPKHRHAQREIEPRHRSQETT